MRTLRHLLCLVLLAPSCTAHVQPDESPAPAPLADPYAPLYPDPRVADPSAPCLSVVGPPGFQILVPIPCLPLWIDTGDPGPPSVRRGH